MYRHKKLKWACASGEREEGKKEAPEKRPCIISWRLFGTVEHKLRISETLGATPLNNPPIEIHTNSSMFALVS